MSKQIKDPQGYIILGVDDFGQQKNITCANSLALSIKELDPDRPVCVVVNDFADLPQRFEKTFDYVVELPYGRSDTFHGDINLDFWQLYNATPFEESIFVDTYSLAVEHIDSLWNAVGDNIAFGTAYNLRREIFKGKRYAINEKNEIPTYDTGIIYWKRSKVASEFFKMADPVFKGWRDIYRDVLTEDRPIDFDFGTLVNTTLHMLGEQLRPSPLFTYTDISIRFPEPEEEDDLKFVEGINIWLTHDHTFKANNYRQTGFVRYGDPSVLTEEMQQKFNDRS